MLKKYKSILIVSYILLLMLSFFYVRSVLNEGNIDVKEKEEEQPSMEVKPAIAYLNFNDGTREITYRARMQNVDSVIDFLGYLRDYENFMFEKTIYNYGIELNPVNSVYAPEGYKWSVFVDDEDITDMVESTNLKDETTYYIKLVPLK